ncbi:UvrD-helicase domain-containing protein [Anaerorhabdus sp.]|uniref:ATP-dependent helicase n=1 Tax=Anaerorhabdus sp. TaxID=1872524 RepID=UPI002B2142C2|nr:UvrD-helicase domain-containing protein [Anaerorhabdus sp.]MEA4874354.1 3'-5' exonuclease [Anaerorhabdus sp.]
MNLLDGLNPNQKEAVLSTDQYLRVIAGAGSGKTRVLTTRIANLVLERNVYPSKILAITFTNKAANEMKERIKKILGDPSGAVWISTIHSLCVRILREDIQSMGMPRNFTVMDQDDQKTILKEAYKEHGIDKSAISFGSMLDYIGNNKGAEITVDRAYVLAGSFIGEKSKAKVYEYYCNRQKELYALDFDDLLLVTVKMFKMFSEIRAKWAKRFNYIHVDEFQDIDKVQYELISQLAGTENSICVVGDPDQTIYTWRGADVNIIMNFEKDYQPCRTIILNENYRSTENILNGANSLIKCNKNRIDKDLYTNRKDPEKISHYISAGEEYEASWIANKISEGHRTGKRYRDFAILYRSNYLSRAIEKGLLDEHIPYIIYGGVKFYERAEIKDALCYLRMISGNDDLALQRVINKPKRGLGNKTMDTIFERAREKNCSMYEVLRDEELFSGKAQATISSFVTMIERWKNMVSQKAVFELLEMVIDESGYRRMLEDDKETERLENLKELINDVQSFTINYPESTLDEYLQLVSLYGDKDESLDGDYVQLMTVHAAKGLEFDTVFVCGLSDGIFPNERAMAEGNRGVEEERRLAYVAFTRARNKLYLTESSGFSYILSKARVRSRFIDEVEEDYVEHLGATFDYGKPKDFVVTENSPINKPVPQILPKSTEPATRWKKGEQVTHGKFGDGIVLKYEGGFLEIAFPYPHGVKKIMATHPSIKKKVA